MTPTPPSAPHAESERGMLRPSEEAFLQEDPHTLFSLFLICAPVNTSQDNKQNTKEQRAMCSLTRLFPDALVWFSTHQRDLFRLPKLVSGGGSWAHSWAGVTCSSTGRRWKLRPRTGANKLSWPMELVFVWFPSSCLMMASCRYICSEYRPLAFDPLPRVCLTAGVCHASDTASGSSH